MKNEKTKNNGLNSTLMKYAKSSLSREEVFALGKIIKESDNEEQVKAAKDLLIKSHLKLVSHIAWSFKGPMLTIDDLIQEGNIGLLEAVDRWDYSRGNVFSTYATFYIKKYMYTYLYSSDLVRMSVSQKVLINRYNRFIEKTMREKGIIPTDEEICKAINVNKKKLADLRRSMGISEVVNIDDGYFDEFGGFEIGQEDENLKNTEKEAMMKVLYETIDELPDVQKFIIKKYWNLNNEGPTCFRAIGEELGFSGTYINNSNAKALAELKRRLTLKGYELTDFFD